MNIAIIHRYHYHLIHSNYTHNPQLLELKMGPSRQFEGSLSLKFLSNLNLYAKSAVSTNANCETPRLLSSAASVPSNGVWWQCVILSHSEEVQSAS